MIATRMSAARMPEADQREAVLAELPPGQLPLAERLEVDLVVRPGFRRRAGRGRRRPSRRRAACSMSCAIAPGPQYLMRGSTNAYAMSARRLAQDDDRRGDEQDAHQDRVVEVAGRIDRQVADARPAEDRLGHDRAGEQERDLEPDVGHDRQHRVAQRVLEGHDAAGKALGLGRPDVVLVERLEHARPDEPGVTRDVDHDEREDRQDQVLPDVEQRVDRLLAEVGPVGRRCRTAARRACPSCRRRAAYVQARPAEQEDQHDPQPERGHGEADVGEDRRRLVEERIAFDGRVDADEDRDARSR